MEDFKKFVIKYKGAIIGGTIAIIIALTGLIKLLVVFAVILIGIWLGNYIQKNKDEEKEKLRNFIDKL